MNLKKQKMYIIHKVLPVISVKEWILSQDKSS